MTTSVCCRITSPLDTRSANVGFRRATGRLSPPRQRRGLNESDGESVRVVGARELVVGVLMTPPAAAQGLYYKEIRKDDRIYVFNNPPKPSGSRASGEMGRASRDPARARRETVVGDSERALQLFFFKHGISEAVPEPTPPIQRIEWRDGKTRITTNLAYLEISNRIQPRYTQEFPTTSAEPCREPAAPGTRRGSFRIRRAKFKLEGWFWIPPECAVARGTRRSSPMSCSSTGRRSPTSARSRRTSARSSRTPTSPGTRQGKGEFRVVFGQYKVPFGRQQMTSSGNQQFVDRSLVSDEYERGRETGVSVQGAIWSNKLEYRVGNVQRQRVDAVRPTTTTPSGTTAA